MDKLSNYSSRHSAPKTQRSEASGSGSSLNRNTRSQSSLARTAGRISNAPSLPRSYATREGSDRAASLSSAIKQEEDEFFRTAMSQKFPMDGMSSLTMSDSQTWIPGVRSEMSTVSREKFTSTMYHYKKNDSEQYKEWSTVESIRSGKASMLRKEYSDYKSGRTSASEYYSHPGVDYKYSASGRSQPTQAGSSWSGLSEERRREIEDADSAYKSNLSSVIAIRPKNDDEDADRATSM